jgi:hypothetical protein
MKHYINFKPTVLYRKGSSFMLKTSVAILYGIPILMVLFYSFNYFSAQNTVRFYQENYQTLKEKTDSFSKTINQMIPDKEELEEKEEWYFDFSKAINAYKTSWTHLFSKFEAISPAGIKFSRVRVHPDKVIKVIIEGKAQKMSDLTDFLRVLFEQKEFMNPELKRHSTQTDRFGSSISFSMIVDYLGKGGSF